MARRRKTDGPNAAEAQARRLVALMLAFSNAHHPMTSEEIRSSYYPELSEATFLKQFSRDRQRLAEAGLLITRERHGRDGAQWEAKATSFADVGRIAPTDALMVDVLCSQLVNDPAFAPRLELCHALEKLDGTYGEVTAARIDESQANAMPALAMLLDCLAKHRVALVSYVDAQGHASERSYAPYGSFGLRDHTYIVCARVDDDGAPTDDIRTLRDDRLHGVRMTKTSYAIPEDFSALDYRRLPFQIGPTVAMVCLLAPEQASDSAHAELRRAGRFVENAPDGEVWEVACSSIDDAAIWSIAEGILPQAPDELVDAWRSRLARVTELSTLSRDAVPQQDPVPRSVDGHVSSPRSSENLTRELIALVGSLRSQGATLSTSGVAARLGITPQRARELLLLVLTASSGASAQLPLALSDDEDELVLCFDRGMRGRPLRFTHAEAAAFETAIDLVGFEEDDPLRRDVLEAFGPLDLSVDEAVRRIEPTLDAEENERIEACSRALVDGGFLNFAYQGMLANKPERRHVQPLAVPFENEHWYLVAFDLDRQAQRKFRIDRMDDVRVTSSTETVRPNKPSEADEQRSVLLRFADRHVLELLLWPHLELVSQTDDAVFATIPYYGGTWLPRRLAACGGSVTTDIEELTGEAQVLARKLLQP